jgi:hypothetical protein
VGDYLKTHTFRNNGLRTICRGADCRSGVHRISGRSLSGYLEASRRRLHPGCRCIVADPRSWSIVGSFRETLPRLACIASRDAPKRMR